MGSFRSGLVLWAGLAALASCTLLTPTDGTEPLSGAPELENGTVRDASPPKLNEPDAAATRPLWLQQVTDRLETPRLIGDFVTGPQPDRTVTLVGGHTATTTCFAISPSGALAASGGYDNRIVLWDTTDVTAVGVLTGHLDTVNDVTFLSETRLASVSDDGTVRIWDTATAAEVAQYDGATWPRAATVWQNNLVWLVGSGKIGIIELSSGKFRPGIAEVSLGLRDVVVTPQGDSVLVSDQEGEVYLVTLPEGLVQKTSFAVQGQARRMAFSPDGEYLAIVGGSYPGSSVSLFDYESPELLWNHSFEQGTVRDIEFTDDGASIVVGRSGEDLEMLSVATGETERVFDGVLLQSFAFLPGSARLVGVTERTLQTLDLVSGASVSAANRRLELTAFATSDSRELVALSGAAHDRSSRTVSTTFLYDMAGGTVTRVPWLPTAQASSVAFSPDSQTLAIGHSNRISVGPITGDENVRQSEPLPGYVTSMAWRPDGTELIVGFRAYDRAARQWNGGVVSVDANTLALKWVSRNPLPPVHDVRYVEDGSGVLAVAHNTSNLDTAFVRFDSLTGAEQYRDEEFRGRMFAAAVDDVSGTFWIPSRTNVIEGEIADGSIRGQRDISEAHGFRRTARYLDGLDAVLFGDESGRMVVVDSESGQERALLQGHTAEIIGVSWDRERSILTTASRDGTVRYWDLQQLRLLASTVALAPADGDDEPAIVTISPEGLVETVGVGSGAVRVATRSGTAVSVGEVLRVGIVGAALTGREPSMPPLARFQDERIEARVRDALDIESGPLFVSDVESVTEIDLSGLGLAEVPTDLRQLTGLRSLNLAGNRITSLPGWLAEFRALAYFKIADNPIRSIAEAAAQSTVLRNASSGFSVLASRIHEFEVLWSLRDEAFGAIATPQVHEQSVTLESRRVFAGTIDNAARLCSAQVVLVPDDLPPGYSRPANTRAVGAFFLRETAIPVFLRPGEPYRFFVDTDLDGDLAEESDFGVWEAVQIRTPAADLWVEITNVEERVARSADYSGQSLPVISYRSATAAIASLNDDVLLILEDVDCNGYVDDDVDHITIADRGRLELTSGEIGDSEISYGGAHYRVAREESGRIELVKLEPPAIREALSWPEGDASLYLRFGRYRWMDGRSVSVPSELTFLTQDGRFILTENGDSFGFISQVIDGGAGGGGGSPVLHDGRGVPVKFPVDGYVSPYTWVEQAPDGMIYFPSIDVNESAVRIEWVPPVNTGHERDDAVAPAALEIPRSALPSGLPIEDRSFPIRIADKREERYLVTLGRGNERALVVITTNGLVVQTYPIGEYQYVRFGRNAEEILYATNGEYDDEYLATRAQGRSYVYRRSGDSRDVLVEQATAFVTNSSGTRVLYVRPRVDYGFELHVLDVDSGRQYPVTFDTSFYSLADLGFVPGTNHVYHVDGRRLVIDEYETDLRGQSYYFAGENVFQLANYTYLTRYPGFLGSIEGREGVWTDGDAPWELADLKRVFANILSLKNRDPQAALNALDALEMADPEEPGWQDTQEQRLSCLLLLGEYDELRAEANRLGDVARQAGLGAGLFGGWDLAILREQRDYAALFAHEVEQYREAPDSYTDISAIGRYGLRPGDAETAYEIITDRIQRNLAEGNESRNAMMLDYAVLYAVATGRIADGYDWLVSDDETRRLNTPQSGSLWGNPIGASFSTVGAVVGYMDELRPLLYSWAGDIDRLRDAVRSMVTSYDGTVIEVLWARVLYDRHPELGEWSDLQEAILQSHGEKSDLVKVSVALSEGRDLSEFVGHEREVISNIRRVLVDLLEHTGSARDSLEAYEAAPHDIVWLRILEYEVSRDPAGATR